MRERELSSPRKRGSNCWIPVFTGMTACLLVSMLAFADEPINPSDYAQPKAALQGKGTASPPEQTSTVAVPIKETLAQPVTAAPTAMPSTEYKVGVNDVLDINVFQIHSA